MPPNSVWKIRPVGEMAKVMSGYAFKSSEFQSEGIPVIKIKNIRDGYVDLTDAQCVDEKYLTSIDTKFQITRGDLLISLTGSHITQPDSVVGRVARYLHRQKSLLNQRGGKITITNLDECDALFLLYMLTSEENSRTIALMAQGAASQANISPSQVESLKIPIPDVVVQRKIAAILSAYDDLIDNNNRRIKILEEMAKLLYREWFVDFRFPGHENVRMVDSPLGKIPEEWKTSQLNEFGTVLTGKTPSKKMPSYYGDYMSFIKTPDMVGNIFIIETSESLSKEGSYSQRNKTLPADTLCVTCIGTPGIVSITSEASQTNQQINSIILNDKVYREFLYFALLGLKETIERYGSTGATMPNLSKGKFESLIMIHPTDVLISRFHDYTEGIFNQIKISQLKNINLRKARDILLPKLISGELDVSGLDIEIPEETA